MKKRSFLTTTQATSGVVRRALLGGAVLLALTLLAGLVAFLTRGEAPADRPKPGASAESGTPTPSPSASSPGTSDPGRPDSDGPPTTGDPVEFAKAAAEALWSYDTRQTSHKKHLDGLQAWMTKEGRYADWASVKKQVPDATLWKRLAGNKQHATGSSAEGRFPQVFQEAMANEPGAITEAYVYVVTVHGKQKLAWTGSGAGAEARSITVGVQCRPEQSCALAGVMPQVLP